MRFLERDIVYYRTANGISPFRIWLDSLRDGKVRSLIECRLNRVEDGNLGDYRSVGDGVYELKIHCGPGYRVYFGFHKSQIIFLMGGDKGSQRGDIWKAKQYWFNCLRRI